MKTMRNEYRDLKKENDLIFSTLAEYDRDTITEIISVVDNTRGIGYEVELVRKDLIAMAAQAEAQRDYLPSVIGDVEVFKRNLLASMPKPKFADYMADSLVWLCTFALVSTATYTVMGRAWDCYYDAVWLVLCIAIIMPSAWLLQRIVPAEWAASTEKGVRYGAITAAMLFLWFVVFWFVDKWITPLLPAVGLPNLAAVILFGAALAVLLVVVCVRRGQTAAQPEPTPRTSAAVRKDAAQTLLDGMSTREKICQLLIVHPEVLTDGGTVTAMTDELYSKVGRSRTAVPHSPSFCANCRLRV